MSFVDCVVAAIPRLFTRNAWTRVGFIAAALACVVQPALGAEPARTTLAGHVLPALAESQQITRKSTSADDNEALTLTVVLKRDDEAAFQRYLADLSDPASPTFHRYADAAAQADRFGPSAAAYAAVRAYFTAQGFAVVDDSANRLTLTLRGTVGQAERSLAVHMAEFSLADRTFRANEN